MCYTVTSHSLSERKDIHMKLQYIGTAAAEGIPALFCNCDTCREAMRRGGKDLRMRSGAIVNDKLIIDLNPDLYAAKLRFGLDLSGVRNAIITVVLVLAAAGIVLAGVLLTPHGKPVEVVRVSQWTLGWMPDRLELYGNISSGLSFFF